MAGKEFWDLVDLDYDVILDKICDRLKNIESAIF